MSFLPFDCSHWLIKVCMACSLSLFHLTRSQSFANALNNEHSNVFGKVRNFFSLKKYEPTNPGLDCLRLKKCFVQVKMRSERTTKIFRLPLHQPHYNKALKETDRQTDRQTNRKTDKQTDKQKHNHNGQIQ